MPRPVPLKLGLVDDHKLFRKGLISLIEMVHPDSVILFEADNGLHLQQKLDPNNLPDILLLDVTMPAMDGFDTVQWLKTTYPALRIIIISMIEKEETIVRMLRLGVNGYLCKDVEPAELGAALRAVFNKGFYYTDFITGKLVHALQNPADDRNSPAVASINDREKQFLQYACSELTYHEIADKMFLSPKTVDGYRNALFEKLNVKSRVGMVIYAIRHRLVKLDWEY